MQHECCKGTHWDMVKEPLLGRPRTGTPGAKARGEGEAVKIWPQRFLRLIVQIQRTYRLMRAYMRVVHAWLSACNRWRRRVHGCTRGTLTFIHSCLQFSNGTELLLPGAG